MKTILGSIWKWIGVVATISSILGLFLSFLSDDKSVKVALFVFCVVLIVILIGVILTLNRLIKQNFPEPYEKISSFYEFKSDDGKKSVFEMYRLIQCKRAVLTHIDYKFKWSGTKKPKLSSNSQELRNTTFLEDLNVWDKCEIHFKTPLTYNESTVVHIRTDNDDYDGKAEPFISTRLDSPIKIMQYKVLLSYKDDSFSEDAVFERKPIDADVDSGWEYLDSIPFESKYKQYQYVIVAPEPGYIYKIRWIK